MKKILIMIFALICAMGMTACESGPSNKNNAVPINNAEQSSTSETSTEIMYNAIFMDVDASDSFGEKEPVATVLDSRASLLEYTKHLVSQNIVKRVEKYTDEWFRDKQLVMVSMSGTGLGNYHIVKSVSAAPDNTIVIHSGNLWGFDGYVTRWLVIIETDKVFSESDTISVIKEDAGQEDIVGLGAAYNNIDHTDPGAGKIRYARNLYEMASDPENKDKLFDIALCMNTTFSDAGEIEFAERFEYLSGHFGSYIKHYGFGRRWIRMLLSSEQVLDFPANNNFGCELLWYTDPLPLIEPENEVLNLGEDDNKTLVKAKDSAISYPKGMEELLNDDRNVNKLFDIQIRYTSNKDSYKAKANKMMEQYPHDVGIDKDGVIYALMPGYMIRRDSHLFINQAAYGVEVLWNTSDEHIVPNRLW